MTLGEIYTRDDKRVSKDAALEPPDSYAFHHICQSANPPSVYTNGTLYRILNLLQTFAETLHNRTTASVC